MAHSKATTASQKRQIPAKLTIKNTSSSRMLPTLWTLSLVFVIMLCLLGQEQCAANAQSPMENWFDRDVRSPKPKFIRFGRANGQKFIRFGRSPANGLGGEDLDALVDAAEIAYFPTVELRQSIPKRAQKFIRFG